MDAGSTLAVDIMKRIREAILTGQLVPDETYTLDKIANKIGMHVSRTPVKEALIRLAEDGMVEFCRGRGVRVHKASLKDLEELFQLRLMLEVPATYRAAVRADDKTLYKLETRLAGMRLAAKESDRLRKTEGLEELGLQERLLEVNLDFVEHDTMFHELIIGAGGNERLVRTVRMWRHLITATGAWMYIHQRGISTVMREHEPVLEAIRNRAPVAAAQYMYAHLTQTGTQLLQELEHAADDGSSFDPSWYEGVAVPEM
jgi:DNA-binding GntR family transcriptional regulator